MVGAVGGGLVPFKKKSLAPLAKSSVVNEERHYACSLDPIHRYRGKKSI